MCQFSWSWPFGAGVVVVNKLSIHFFSSSVLSPFRKGCDPFFEQTWFYFIKNYLRTVWLKLTQWFWKRWKCEKTDVQTDWLTNGQQKRSHDPKKIIHPNITSKTVGTMYKMLSDISRYFNEQKLKMFLLFAFKYICERKWMSFHLFPMIKNPNLLVFFTQIISLLSDPT